MALCDSRRLLLNGIPPMKQLLKLNIIIALTFLLYGCKDDKLSLSDSEASIEKLKGASLVINFDAATFDGEIKNDDFTGFIPSEGGIHNLIDIGDEEENTINPVNFRIMIFGKNGDFWDEWINHEMQNISQIDKTVWAVKIPLTEIHPETIEKMRKDKFKVAVFANWHQYPEFNKKPEEGSYENIDKNSIFYMTHCMYDSTYESYTDDDIGKDDNSLGVYGFITGSQPMMGMSQDWVWSNPKWESEADAQKTIRERYNVAEDYFPSESGFNYNHSWIVWNFGGPRNLRENRFYDTNNQNEDKREALSQISDDWYKALFYTNGGENEDDLTQNDENHSATNTSLTKDIKIRELEYIINGGTTEGAVKTNEAGDHLRYGINIRVLKYDGTNSVKNTTGNIRMDQAVGSYFHFYAPANGTIKVKCETIGETSQGIYLIARNGDLNTTSSVTTVAKEIIPGVINDVTFDWNDKTVRIEKDPEHFCLYSTGSLRIYEIEYIKDRNIFESDRQSILPSETPEGGISMYGIQDYDALGYNIWPEGTTFNLSDGTLNAGEDAANYTYRDVFMLRSVAKCEVFIKKSAFPQPAHIFMRSMNRESRSNPMDVYTPTDILWNGWNANDPEDKREGVKNSPASSTAPYIDYKTAQGIDKEYYFLDKYGLNYKTYSENTDQSFKETEYKNTVAWLFGTWAQQFGWNWGDNSINEDYVEEGPEKHYPRVFNTRILRNDYTHLIYGGEDNEYYYYYMYLPERNVTDPNNAGKLDERPKLLHLEIKFDGRNGDVNMDDNSSYRVYFTDNGKIRDFNNRTEYDDMENKITPEELGKIYSVVRNHVYRFYIRGIDMNGLDVKMQIARPQTREINYTFD